MDFWLDFAYYILMAEIFVIIIFLIIIPLHRVYLYYKKSGEDAAKRKISQMIIDYLQNRKDLNSSLLQKFSGSSTLLSTMEAFDRRIREDDWTELKNMICELYLLPRARELAYGSSWVTRNFAARCFVLSTRKEDRNIIINLVHDPVFLVRSVASIATCHLGQKEGVYEILRQMSIEKGYARCFYRDLLLQTTNRTFAWVKEIAETENDQAIHLACLEVLSFKMTGKIPECIKKDLNSNNSDIRLAAAKIVARDPQIGSVDMLIKCLEDPDPKIREEAVSGLKYFASDPIYKKLQESLKDSVWLVRLGAAQTLKKMGKKGVDILKEQNSKNDLNAYQAAQIALQYD